MTSTPVLGHPHDPHEARAACSKMVATGGTTAVTRESP